MARWSRVAAASALIALALPVPGGAAHRPTLERIGGDSAATFTQGCNGARGISMNGRWVPVRSEAPLAGPNPNGQTLEAYLVDRLTGSALPVAVTSGGERTSGASEPTGITADGREVFFTSSDPDLVPGDGNEQTDLFAHDRTTGKTAMLSKSTFDVQSDGSVSCAAPSADGRWVAFASNATNLVDDDENFSEDVFLRGRDTDWNDVFDEPGGVATWRISTATDGTEGDGVSDSPSISEDGDTIAYRSTSTTLDPDDTEPGSDIYLWFGSEDPARTVVASADAGTCDHHSPSLDELGTAVAWVDSCGSVWYRTILYDDADGSFAGLGEALRLVSGGGRTSASPQLVAMGGPTVVFETTKTLSGGDVYLVEDIYAIDADTRAITLLSQTSSGATGAGRSTGVRLSGDGDHVAFTSLEPLERSDTNGLPDVWVRDWRVSDHGWAASNLPDFVEGDEYIFTSQTTVAIEITHPEPDVTYECALDGGSLAACPRAVSYTGLSEGHHRFRFRVIDWSGEPEPVDEETRWFVDTTPPAGSWVAPSPGVTVGGVTVPAPLTIVAGETEFAIDAVDDESGIRSVTFHAGGQSYPATADGDRYSFLYDPDGRETITAEIANRAGVTRAISFEVIGL